MGRLTPGQHVSDNAWTVWVDTLFFTLFSEATDALCLNDINIRKNIHKKKKKSYNNLELLPVFIWLNDTFFWGIILLTLFSLSLFLRAFNSWFYQKY